MLESSGRDNLESRLSVRLCGTCWEPLKTAAGLHGLPPQCALMRACAWLVWAVLVRSARTEAEGSLSAQFGDGAYKQPTWDRRDEEQSQARPLSRPRASRSHALSAVGARLCDR